MRRALKYICILLLVTSTAHAYEVQPLIQRMEVAKGVSYSSIQIRNTSDQPLPVEISTHQLELLDGSPHKGVSAENELLVFPPSVLIAPSSTQVVRIQWISELQVEKDTSFIVLIEQLPNAESREGVQMLLAFNAVVHVQAPNSSSEIEVTKSRITIVETLPVLEVELYNSGNGNAYGHEITLQLEWDSKSRTIPANELANYVTDLFLPPGYRRTVEIPVPDMVQETSVVIHVRSNEG